MKTFYHNNRLIESNDNSIVIPDGSIEITDENMIHEYKKRPQDFTFDEKSKSFKKSRLQTVDLIEKQKEKIEMFLGQRKIDEKLDKK